MIAIDLGHRFGRLGRLSPDGRPDVATTELAGTDGVLDPVRALPRLLPDAPAGAPAGTEPEQSAVLGLPATGGREEELRRAAERAGLEVQRVVPDPVAVALHYGAVAEGVDLTVLVCDQGATTLDLSVLAITPDLTVRVVATHALPLGGDDWDAALAAELAGRLPGGVEPRRAAETLRRALGGSESVTACVPDLDGGPHSLPLDRATVERAVAPLRERTLTAVAERLTAAEPAVDTVLLAGGLCATPGRRAEIEELPAAQGLTVRCEQPGSAVVNGLLRLPEFEVLRIVTGPAPRSVHAGAGYVPRDPVPPPAPLTDSLTDPDPRTGHPQPWDPEPVAHRGAPTGVPGPGQRDATGSPAGTGDPRDAPPQPPDAGAAEPPPSAGPPPSSEPPPPPSSEPPPSTGPPPSAEPPPPPSSEPPPSTGPPLSSEPPPPPSSEPPPAAEPSGGSGGSAGFAVPVEQLQAIRRGDHLLVRWAWPAGASTARVRWRREAGPGVRGPREGAALCGRRAYEHDGGFDLAVGRGEVTLTVEALLTAPRTDTDTEGAASLVVPAQPPVVTYQPTVRRRLRGRVASVTFVSPTGCALPELHIVHSLGRFRPTSPAEGTVVHRVAARRLPAGTPWTVEFPLPATRGPSWLVCFPADPNAGTGSGPESGSESGSDSGTESGTHSGTGGHVDIRPTALHRLRVT